MALWMARLINMFGQLWELFKSRDEKKNNIIHITALFPFIHYPPCVQVITLYHCIASSSAFSSYLSLPGYTVQSIIWMFLPADDVLRS